MSNTPQPVLIMNSVLAGLGVVLGGTAALTEYLSPELVGLLVLIHAGVTLAWGLYVRGRVYPQEKVAAYRDDAGQLRAGKASVVQDNKPVDVTAAGPSPYGSAWEAGGENKPG